MSSSKQTPPGPGVVDEDKLLKAMSVEIHAHLQGLVELFAPPQKLSPLQLQSFATAMAKEQLELGKGLIPALHLPDAVQQLPHVGVRIFKTVDGKPGSPPIKDSAHVFLVHKQFVERGEDCHVHVLSTALFLALVLMAPVRGLLRLHGYHYDFISPKLTEPPKISLVKG